MAEDTVQSPAIIKLRRGGHGTEIGWRTFPLPRGGGEREKKKDKEHRSREKERQKRRIMRGGRKEEWRRTVGWRVEEGQSLDSSLFFFSFRLNSEDGSSCNWERGRLLPCL